MDARICLFVGRFGCGKTEIALNYALWLAGHTGPVWQGTPGAPGPAGSPQGDRAGSQRPMLIDLDIVTPYFRSRQMADRLAGRGVDVVAPAAVAEHLDVPALTPQIMGAIQQPSRPVVLDVGGDEQGARALGQYSQALAVQGYRMHMVVNPYRPFTDTVGGVQRALDLIESTSRLRASALVSNPNLMAETTPSLVRQGHAQVKAMAQEMDLPVAFLGIDRALRDAFSQNSFDLPVLWLERHFIMPWDA
jgi:hypothetical protein